MTNALSGFNRASVAASAPNKDAFSTPVVLQMNHLCSRVPRPRLSPLASAVPNTPGRSQQGGTSISQGTVKWPLQEQVVGIFCP